MINKVIMYFGSQSALAIALGVTEGAVSQWVSSGVIPPARAVQIERITDGKFKAIDWQK
jgi:DNA-binding transcriptional regulator YdaS (Cro superfamily)